MQPEHCRILCFSPTGGTRVMAEAVAAGLGLPFEVLDFTLPAQRERLPELRRDEVLILAVPVYYGRVTKIAAKYLAGLRGQGQRAVLLVNFGNRDYEDALLELLHIARACGLEPVAAGAFISEHAYSTAEFPLASGRPDEKDLAFARRFGSMAGEKITRDGEALHSLPGNVPYKAYPDFHRAPVCRDNCTLCGSCVAFCPTGAITVTSGSVLTDEQACIVCQACVKYCPEQARVDSGPGALETRQHLAALIADRREPEIFL